MKAHLFAQMLRALADNIEDGSCQMTQEQIDALVEEINNRPMSKEQARVYMNMSRSNFDRLIREGKLPRGKKVRGLTELIWYKRDLTRLEG